MENEIAVFTSMIVVQEKYIVAKDSKYYSTASGAKKRCESLRAKDDRDWKVFKANTWEEVE